MTDIQSSNEQQEEKPWRRKAGERWKVGSRVKGQWPIRHKIRGVVVWADTKMNADWVVNYMNELDAVGDTHEWGGLLAEQRNTLEARLKAAEERAKLADEIRQEMRLARATNSYLMPRSDWATRYDAIVSKQNG